LLLNDEREREGQRNNLFFFLLMMSAMLLYMSFMSPSSTPHTPPPPVVVPGVDVASDGSSATDGEPESVAGGITLPPVASGPQDPALDEVVLEDPYLRLTFTRVGGRLKRAEVVLGEAGRDSIQLVPEAPLDAPDAEVAYPLGLRFASNFLGDALDRRLWEAARDPDGLGVQFSLELPGQARVVKSFRLGDRPHVVSSTVSYTHLGASPLVLGLDQTEPAFSLTWGPNVASNDLSKGVPQEIVFHQGGLNTHHYTSDLALPSGPNRFSVHARDAEWAAIKSAYFVVALRPGQTQGESWVLGVPDRFTLGVGAPRSVVEPGGTVSAAFEAYVGPTHLRTLREGWDGLEAVLQFFTMSGFGWMDSFAKILLSILNWFHDRVYASYGVAIIFLTVLVRMVMFPLTFKSMKSMKKMQKLAPELEKIKEEVGDDQQELQKRMMELYREHGVNPVSGCFPILLQMPVFIALYRMLWSAFELRRAPYLWMEDLSEPDRLFPLPIEIPVPFVQTTLDSVNLLPFLMAAAMFASTKLMPTSTAMQNPQQKFIMNAMPIIFCVFCYTMPSGLNLYILTSTLLGIVQNYLVHVSDTDMQDKKPRRRWGDGSKHFYDVAQARKRELHKEQRREKKQKPYRAEAKVNQQDPPAAGKRKR
jgi:YidC/Oxa1 family membrane protein insertase